MLPEFSNPEQEKHRSSSCQEAREQETQSVAEPLLDGKQSRVFTGVLCGKQVIGELTGPGALIPLRLSLGQMKGLFGLADKQRWLTENRRPAAG